MVFLQAVQEAISSRAVPQGLSSATSQLPSSCFLKTSLVRPLQSIGLPSESTPVRVHAERCSVVSGPSMNSRRITLNDGLSEVKKERKPRRASCPLATDP